ncbi:SUKH-4 family immunity protein [Streptomyces sp. NRRL B-24484]|uniref:SUKH-4 family immunity protein n=1 Tax=Streptomyces sp. NRRL B-24484 TaxID=1463833 RepID=UPI0004C1BDC1|nr:SUKH-4 family immunity protein [Streptomyces sp. NRRL B-24484]
MSHPLLPLPEPAYVLIRVEAPPEAPARIADRLREPGIPGGLIGYEYRPLGEPLYLGAVGEQGAVAVAASGLFGYIAVDAATGQVVQVPRADSAATRHVNGDLDSFTRCVEAVIARFPFYAEDEEDRFGEVAEELRALLSGIDGTALAHSGFWETFCDDVEMGSYADGDD